MVNNTVAEAPEVETEAPKPDAALQIETDADRPWAVVIIDGTLRINPGIPAFRTQEDARTYVRELQTKDPKWPGEGQVEYEWRPDLEENPNSQKARELLDEVDHMTASDDLAADHSDAVEKLLAAQVYATLAVRDQIAGFGCDFGGLPVRFPSQRG